MSDRICCYCRRVYGQVDTSEPIHGVCPECAVEVEKEVRLYEKEHSEMVKAITDLSKGE